MAKITKGARMRNKVLDTPLAKPTIPENNDHTTGWRSTDIYEGEFLVNTTDRRMWVRTSGTSIAEVALLDDNGLLPGVNIPPNSSGAVTYRGTWDASQLTPPTTNPTKGDYYVVNNYGTTSLDGITPWNVNDWAIHNGSSWSKLANTAYTPGNNISLIRDLQANTIIDIVDNPTIVGNLRVNLATYTGTLGVGTITPAYLVHIYKDFTGIADLVIENINVGPSAGASMSLKNNVGKTYFNVYSSVYTGFLNWQNSAVLTTESTIIGGLVIHGEKIRFQNLPGQNSAILKNGKFGVGTFSTGTADIEPLSQFTLEKAVNTGYVEFRMGSNDGSIRDMLLKKNTTAPFDFNIIAGASADTPSEMNIFMKNGGTPVIAFRTYEDIDVSIAENIGIGTTAPIAPIHIVKNKNLNTEIIIENTTSGSVSKASARVKSNSGSGWFSATNSAFSTYANWSSALVLEAENTLTNGIIMYSANKIRFKNTPTTETLTVVGSKVGIGTDVPLYLVHVKTDQNALTEIYVQNDQDGDQSGAAITVKSQSAFGGIKTYSTAYTTVVDWIDTVVMYADATASGGLLAYSPNKFRVQTTQGINDIVVSNKKVGIGLPNTEDISGDLVISNTTKTGTLTFKMGVNDAVGNIMDATFKKSMDVADLYALKILAGSHPTAAANMYFYLRDNGIPIISFVYNLLYGGENVGIGTTTPTKALHVVRNVNENTLFLIENTTNGIVSGAGVQVKSNIGSGFLYANSSAYSTYSTFNSALVLEAEDTLTNGIIMYNANKIRFKNTRSLDTLTIVSDKVGVGTSNPLYLLHVKTDQNLLTELYVENNQDGTQSGSAITVKSQSAFGGIKTYSNSYVGVVDWVDSVILHADAGASGGLVSYSPNKIRFQTTAGEDDVIIKNKFVGIGLLNTETPTANLMVSNRTKTGTVKIKLGNNDSAGNIKDATFKKSMDATDLYALKVIAGSHATDAANMFFYLKDGGDPIISFVYNLTYGGENVGIGTVTPESILHIVRNQNANTTVGADNTSATVAARASIKLKSNAGEVNLSATSTLYNQYVGWASTAILQTTLANGILIYDPNKIRLQNNATYSTLNILGNKVAVGSSGPSGLQTDFVPSSVLHVRQDLDSDTFITIQNNNNLDQTRVGLNIKGNSDNINMYLTQSLYTDNLSIQKAGIISYVPNTLTNSNGLIIHSTKSVRLQNTLGTDVLSVKNEKVGIGISDAVDLLHVYKNQAAGTWIRVGNDMNNASATAGIMIENFASRIGYVFTTNTSYTNVTNWKDSFVFSTNPTASDTALTGGMIFHSTRDISFQNVKGTDAIKLTGGNVAVDVNTNIGTDPFIPGFTGSGWKIYKDIANEYTIESDNMTLRGTLSVYELLIQQIRATNGNIMVSSTGKVETIINSTSGSEVLKMEDPQGHGASPFAVGDLIICQRVDLGGSPDGTGLTDVVKRHVRVVLSFSGVNITLGKRPDMPLDVASIQEGDEFVRFGNESDLKRQGGVYLTADEDNAPYIDIFAGVSSWTTWKAAEKIKARLGRLANITDSDAGLDGGVWQNNLFGLYSDSVYLSGHINAKTGKIGNFLISADSVRNDAGTLYMSNLYNKYVVLKTATFPADLNHATIMNTDSAEKVEMYAGSSSDWGIKGIIYIGSAYEKIFQLGSTNQIAKWKFDNGSLWSDGVSTSGNNGKLEAPGVGAGGVELNAINKRISAHKDNQNYTSMSFTDVNNWGIRGVVSNSVLFQLGYEASVMKNQIANWYFDTTSLWSGGKLGISGGVEINSANRYFSAHADGLNYARLHYNTSSDWGIRGLINGESLFNLGATTIANTPNNHIAGWIFEKGRLYNNNVSITNGQYLTGTYDTEFRIDSKSTQIGTATASTTITLTDSTKTWTVNQFANMTVTIIGGTGSGQTRTIVSNTANTLTVTPAFSPTLNTTSKYMTNNSYVRMFMAYGTNSWGIEAKDILGNSLFYLGQKNGSPYNQIASWFWDNDKMWSGEAYGFDTVNLDSSGVELNAKAQNKHLMIYNNNYNYVKMFNYMDATNLADRKWGIRGAATSDGTVTGTQYTIFRLGDKNYVAGWKFSDTSLWSNGFLDENDINWNRGLLGISEGIEMNAASRYISVHIDGTNYVRTHFNTTTDWGIRGVLSGVSIFNLGANSDSLIPDNHIAGWQFEKGRLFNNNVSITNSSYGAGTSDTEFRIDSPLVGNPDYVRMFMAYGTNSWGIEAKDVLGNSLFYLGQKNGSPYNQIASWFWDNDKMWSGEAYGFDTVNLDSSGVELNAKSKNKHLMIYNNNYNYIKMFNYMDDPTNLHWGIRGAATSDGTVTGTQYTIFRLGDKNYVAGWKFNNTSLWSDGAFSENDNTWDYGLFSLGNPGIELNADSRFISIHKDGSNYVKMHFDTATNWGIRGIVGGQSLFNLGASSDGNIPNNHIAGWIIDRYKLYNNLTSYGITLAVGSSTQGTDAEVRVDAGTTNGSTNFVRLFSKSDGTGTWGIQGVEGTDSTPSNSIFYLGKVNNVAYNKIAEWRFDAYKLWALNEYGVGMGVQLDASNRSIKSYLNSTNVVDMFYGSTLLTGTATSGSINTLTNGNISMVTSVYINKTLVITKGMGVGQQRTITANTTTMFTVTPNFTTTPNTTSQYAVIDTDWGLRGIYNSNYIFQLGSTNKIAEWTFNNTRLYSTSTVGLNTSGIVLDATSTNRHIKVFLNNETDNYVNMYYGLRKDGGTLTTGSTLTLLKDTTKTWVVNAYTNMTVSLISGTGAGQKGIITSNTSNTLTVTGLVTTPNTTTVYDILSNDWGLQGKIGTYEYFHLGSTNQIAGWNFDSVKMWNTNGTKSIYVSNYHGQSTDVYGRGFSVIETAAANDTGAYAVRVGQISDYNNNTWTNNGYGFQIVQKSSTGTGYKDIFRVSTTGSPQALIAGWKFDSGYLWTGSVPMQTDGYDANGITLSSAGAIRSKNFYISAVNGNAYFKGYIEATSGKIGGWNLDATYLYNSATPQTTNGYAVAPANMTIGAGAIRAYNFYIDSTNGNMVARGGDIGGWNIGTDKLESDVINTSDNVYDIGRISTILLTTNNLTTYTNFGFGIGMFSTLIDQNAQTTSGHEFVKIGQLHLENSYSESPDNGFEILSRSTSDPQGGPPYTYKHYVRLSPYYCYFGTELNSRKKFTAHVESIFYNTVKFDTATTTITAGSVTMTNSSFNLSNTNIIMTNSSFASNIKINQGNAIEFDGTSTTSTTLISAVSSAVDGLEIRYTNTGNVLSFYDRFAGSEKMQFRQGTGIIYASGGFTTTSGNISTTSGGLSTTSGNISTTSGNVTSGTYMTAGTYVSASSYITAGTYVSAKRYITTPQTINHTSTTSNAETIDVSLGTDAILNTSFAGGLWVTLSNLSEGDSGKIYVRAVGANGSYIVAIANALKMDTVNWFSYTKGTTNTLPNGVIEWCYMNGKILVTRVTIKANETVSP